MTRAKPRDMRCMRRRRGAFLVEVGESDGRVRLLTLARFVYEAPRSTWINAPGDIEAMQVLHAWSTTHQTEGQ